MNTCPHKNFEATVDFFRVRACESCEKPDSILYYEAELSVMCSECGQELEFVGLPTGSSAYRPTASGNGYKARLPMVVPGESVPAGLPDSVSGPVFLNTDPGKIQ